MKSPELYCPCIASRFASLLEVIIGGRRLVIIGGRRLVIRRRVWCHLLRGGLKCHLKSPFCQQDSTIIRTVVHNQISVLLWTHRVASTSAGARAVLSSLLARGVPSRRVPPINTTVAAAASPAALARLAVGAVGGGALPKTSLFALKTR